MNKLLAVLISAAFVLTAGSVVAADDMKKDEMKR